MQGGPAGSRSEPTRPQWSAMVDRRAHLTRSIAQARE